MTFNTRSIESVQPVHTIQMDQLHTMESHMNHASRLLNPPFLPYKQHPLQQILISMLLVLIKPACAHRYWTHYNKHQFQNEDIMKRLKAFLWFILNCILDESSIGHSSSWKCSCLDSTMERYCWSSMYMIKESIKTTLILYFRWERNWA